VTEQALIWLGYACVCVSCQKQKLKKSVENLFNNLVRYLFYSYGFLQEKVEPRLSPFFQSCFSCYNF
jgi:hypothetical protein